MTTSQTTNALVSNFYCIFKRDMDIIQFNLKSVSLPDITFGVVEVPWMSLRMKEPGESLTFDPLQFEVIMDKDFEVYTQLYDDLILGANPVTGVLQPAKKKFTLSVVITSNKNNPILKFVFYDAFITTFGSMTMDLTSEMIVMPITAEYKYFDYVRLT